MSENTNTQAPKVEKSLEQVITELIEKHVPTENELVQAVVTHSATMLRSSKVSSEIKGAKRTGKDKQGKARFTPAEAEYRAEDTLVGRYFARQRMNEVIERLG